MTMMRRRHARSESTKIVRKVSVVAPETPASAEIGSRVFPLPVSSATMPSARGRRSTRVFVPKASRDLDSRVLGPGKSVAGSEDGEEKRFEGGGESVRVLREGELIRWFEDGIGALSPQSDANSVVEGGMRGEFQEESGGDGNSSVGKKFGVVYDRKRRRGSNTSGTWGESESSSSLGENGDSRRNQRFGVVFSRKECDKKIKVMPLEEGKTKEDDIQELVGETECGEMVLRVAETSRRFAESAGVLMDDVVSVFSGRIILVFLVEPYSCSGCRSFSQLLIGILRWLVRARVNLRKFAAFLLSGSLASVFSRHGVHILPSIFCRDSDSLINALPSYGVCKVYGERKSTPSVWLGFLSVPSYFKTLHISLLVRKLCQSAVLTRYLPSSLTGFHVEVQLGKHKIDVRPEIFYIGNEVSVPEISSVQTDELHTEDNLLRSTSPTRSLQLSHNGLHVEVHFEEFFSDVPSEIVYQGNGLSPPGICFVQRDKSHIFELPRSDAQNVGLDLSKFGKHKKKRSSPRYFRKRNMSSMEFSNWNNVGIDLKAKQSIISELVLEPMVPEVSDSSTDDSSCQDESDISTPMESRNKHTNTTKRIVDQIKEKTDLAKLRQDIMTACCKANVLVINGDRCWREEGFEVMLDLSSSGEYVIAVKAQDEIKYSHKPMDLKPCCVVNRVTRAYMWTAEDGWKLEFLERWDWLVFKELHMECQERNRLEALSKVIPVPGVHLVSGYDEYTANALERSDEYITVKYDEVMRALECKNCIYDMDSDDEAWLSNFNACLDQPASIAFSNVSEEQFENIIYTFEKDAYRNTGDLFDKEKALKLYHDLFDRDALSAIYDYWRKKRNKRHAALVRIFQGPPLRKVQLRSKSLVSKKRSFKRQRSQSGRQTQEVIVEAEEKDEASLKRVQEAESAADLAAQSAINLRSRAQILMANAELVVYKSVMALKIADAIRVLGSTESASSLLDLVGETDHQ